jgi:hypothetical protein
VLPRVQDPGLPPLPGGLPAWVLDAPYSASAHPGAPDAPPIGDGANCQRYAYAVVALFGRSVPPVRSSELWTWPAQHPGRADALPLDLALVNGTEDAWGAHVAVVTRTALLHLCSEVGRPAVWTWQDFARRPRYAHLVGLVRP